MQPQPASEKIPYLTLAQVLSAVAVVFLHVNGCFWTFSTESWWESANVIECVCFFAVPMFFMITGVTLIDYPARYDLKTYFRKRARKALLPFVVWSLIGLAYQCWRGAVSSDQITLPYVLRGLVQADIIPIYWFFPPLFSIYLSMPIFAAVPREKRKSVFGYLLAAAICVNVAIPFFITILHIPVNWPLTVGAASGYLILVLGGVWLQENPPGRKLRLCLYLLGLAGLAAHILGTWRLSMAAGEIVRTYKGYANLPNLMYTFALFVFLGRVGARVMASRCGALVRAVGKYTLPIYLLHWFILDTFERDLHVPVTALWYRLAAPFVIVMIAMAITWLLRKIPGVRAIVP